jgi:hypothetical protein
MTWNYSFLCALAKLRKATISFVMSVCLSVRPYGITRLRLNGFSRHLILQDFSKIGRLLSSFYWNLTRITSTLHVYVFTLWWYLVEFFLEWGMFPTNLYRKWNTRLMFSIFFLESSGVLWDNVKKYCTARQAINDSLIRRMGFTCWITKAINTHSESELLLAFPLQLVARTCLDATLCVYCLSCWIYFWILA